MLTGQAVLLALVCVGCPGALAQQGSCALVGIRHSAPTAYPMLARAAHVSGAVTLQARFSADGTPTSVIADDAPAMLLANSKEYVASWAVNATPRGQTCEIVMVYRFSSNPVCDLLPSTVTAVDPQHIEIVARPVSTCDPSEKIVRRRHMFLFFHWYTHISGSVAYPGPTWGSAPGFDRTGFQP